ncbi:MAG TPA: Ig-like domain-containing protein, partial [Bacilli bacterium]|nr:Ig-like domain-containing protein [Bacilli bacterium]
MFKNVKKWAIALVLVFGLFLLVGCTTECPECKDPTESQCNELFPCEEPADPTKAECEALYPSEKCPTCEVCEECPACPECPEIPACVQDFVAPTSIILFGDDVKVGETFNLAGEMEVAPATAAKLFTWASSDPSIATVDADGVVTGVRPGKVEITAKSVLNTTAATTEVTVSETGSAFDIATREVAYIAGLLSGYIADDFALPKPWNGNVKVVYDVDGDVIESFVMPDLGEATSLAYTINYTVTFGDVTLSNTVNLKLVKEVEDNDFAKVDAAIEVATKLFSNITAGVGTDKISADIQLPPSYDGVAYNWTTNKNYILTNDGKFTRPDNDTTVTYTISPKAGAAAKSATLVFNINGYSAAEKHAYNVEEGVFAGIAGATVSSSFLLPLLDEKFGISYDYVLPAGLTLTPLPGGNGKYVGAEYDGVAAKTDAEIKVTARYEEEAGFQFIENYVIKVNLVPGNAAFADLNNFMNGTNVANQIDLDGNLIKGSDLTVIPHMPYGGNGTENMVIKLPTTVGGSAVTWVADENFEEQAAGQFKLVTQYFRYHEAKLTATFTNAGDSLKAVFYINVGIAEKPLTYYQGGRSNSYQASSNPAKRGDMLQGFSYWDKYVGTVASSGERTNQWWSEFSGYTFWIDEDVNYVNVKLTKNDTTGVITAVPEAAVKTIRYQLFVMEFEVNRIYDTQNIGGKHVARIDVRFVRSTYGGNFNHFLVNETGVDLDIPVSALSMGGYFADDETVMKTYSLTSLKIGTTTVLDDYGASFKVSREQSIAYDGYRPGFSLK